MDDGQAAFFIGHHDPKRSLPITTNNLQDAHALGYDMLTCPITTPLFHTRVLSKLSTHLPSSSSTSSIDLTRSTNASPIEIEPLTPLDTPLTPDEVTGQLIGVTSSWIDLASPDPVIADVSRQVLKLEIAYAAFCGITYVLIPGPRMQNRADDGSGIVQFGRAILDALTLGPWMQLYIWLPMIDHSDDDVEDIGNLSPFARQQYLGRPDDSTRRLDLFGTWEAWNSIRSVCKYSSRLFVAVALPKLLPPVPIQSRWYSEPVRVLTLDGSVFTKNNKGYPVLSKAHQALVTRFIRHKNPPWFLLGNVGSIPAILNGTTSFLESSAFPSLAEASSTPKDPAPHLSYMRNLQNRQPPPTLMERSGAGYQDYLQAPLQPLTVNLESITYEVFEKDPVKYDWYERAIARALSDWKSHRKPASGIDGRIVVAVVGAGRGPLVTRALKAAESVGIDIDMWALEKNPNAFVLLQRHNDSIWKRRVNLVKSDMRTWRGPVREDNTKRLSQMPATTPAFTGSADTDSTYLLATAARKATNYKIDIIVSELLGSFGDNELSPECLDGVQHLLNPTHGISIPTSYTAFISPIATPKLFADINNNMSQATPRAAEIPYVVMLNAIDHLSTATPVRGNTIVNGAASPTKPPAAATDSNADPPQSPLSSHPTNPTNPTLTQPYSKAHTTGKALAGSATEPTLKRASSVSLPPAPIPVVLPAWSFHHPNPSLSTSPPTANTHNTRHTVLNFPIPHRGLCHGLAGYFECVLYTSTTSTQARPPVSKGTTESYLTSPSVVLSTNPNTMPDLSPDMMSWFPLFFPLKNAVWFPDDSEAVVNVWRKEDARKVWYEWKVDAYMKMGKKGKIRLGGSEVHSSEEEGCLM